MSTLLNSGLTPVYAGLGAEFNVHSESMKNVDCLFTKVVSSTEVSAFLAGIKGCIDLSVLKRSWMESRIGWVILERVCIPTSYRIYFFMTADIVAIISLINSEKNCKILLV